MTTLPAPPNPLRSPRHGMVLVFRLPLHRSEMGEPRVTAPAAWCSEDEDEGTPRGTTSPRETKPPARLRRGARCSGVRRAAQPGLLALPPPTSLEITVCFASC